MSFAFIQICRQPNGYRQTLFKVIPKSKFEGLGYIREALNIYLNTPAITHLEVLEQFTSQDVAVTQWQANVMHLKSQLTLANTTLQMKEAILQMKDATIESLMLTNYQHQQFALDHAPKVQVNQEEDIIKGIVAVTKIEGKGLSINLPEIIRRLKRLFGSK